MLLVVPSQVPLNTLVEALCCLPVLLLWMGPAALVAMGLVAHRGRRHFSSAQPRRGPALPVG